jgi:hypothetical protein
MEPNAIQASYEAVLNDLQTRKEREILEVTAKIAQKFDALIAAVQAAATGEVAPLELSVGSTVSVSENLSMAVNAPVRITTGEFHGMSYTSAARSILERTNKTALTTQQILKYIQQSGRKVEGKNPAGTIYSSLKRGPDFELVAKNTWGLAAWYGIKRKAKPDKGPNEAQESEPAPEPKPDSGAILIGDLEPRELKAG